MLSISLYRVHVSKTEDRLGSVFLKKNFSLICWTTWPQNSLTVKAAMTEGGEGSGGGDKLAQEERRSSFLHSYTGFGIFQVINTVVKFCILGITGTEPFVSRRLAFALALS